jgi:hypothetical protein
VVLYHKTPPNTPQQADAISKNELLLLKLEFWRIKNKFLSMDGGPKRDEVTGEWRKLHNEELRDLYSSPSIIRIIKSRRMR